MPTSPIEALRASEKNTQQMLERNPNNLLMLAQLGYIRKDLANVYFQEGRRTKGKGAPSSPRMNSPQCCAACPATRFT